MSKRYRYSVEFLCKIANISRSTYYFELNKKDKDIKNSDLIDKIKYIYYKHKRNYGVRRIYHELINSGVKVNHKKVQRLMKKNFLTAIKQPKKYHSYQGHVGAVADNLLMRNFKADKPNRKWTTDISQFSFSWGKCYLSPIMDMFNNEIIAYDLSTKPNFEQIERMLSNANLDNRDLSNLTIHSDQGWQYQNPRYVNILKTYGIKQSMSRKGNCYDNGIMESFFGVLKNEMFYSQEYSIKNFNEFKKIVESYIDYYNNERIKEKTNWMSPVQYRLNYECTS